MRKRGYIGPIQPKTDLRGPKMPPIGASWTYVELCVGYPFWTIKIWLGWEGGSGKEKICPRNVPMTPERTLNGPPNCLWLIWVTAIIIIIVSKNKCVSSYWCPLITYLTRASVYHVVKREMTRRRFQHCEKPSFVFIFLFFSIFSPSYTFKPYVFFASRFICFSLFSDMIQNSVQKLSTHTFW